VPDDLCWKAGQTNYRTMRVVELGDAGGGHDYRGVVVRWKKWTSDGMCPLAAGDRVWWDNGETDHCAKQGSNVLLDRSHQIRTVSRSKPEMRRVLSAHRKARQTEDAG